MSIQPQLTVVAEDAQHDSTDCSDRLLLDAWISHRDADAFGALVRRYAGIVIGVCRRQCKSVEDAEDAFQATFLVLSRDAKRLRRVESLAGWLHQVAYRTAARARTNNHATECLYEEPLDTHDSLTAIAQRHRMRTLDEELNRLPKSYRDAIVLHYYEGHSYDQTAELLNTTEPAIRGRLQRARSRLHRRLICRGVSVPVALGALSIVGTQQAVAATLVQQTVLHAKQNSISGAVDSSLESLLVSETSLMFSPAVLGVACAATLTIAGFLAGQIDIDPGSGKKQVTIVGDNGQQSPALAQTFVSEQDSPAAKKTVPDPFGSDPLAAPSRAAADDPFNSGPQKQGAKNAKPRSDPFGSDPFNSGPPKQVVEIAKPGSDPFGSAAPKAAKPQPNRKPIPWATANSEIFAQIEKKLTEPASFSFVEAPLEEAVAQLQEKYELPILIDRRALEEVGLTPDSPINLDLKKVSLRAGLNLMLRGLDLTYTIDDEHLQITTMEDDEQSHQLLRVYWVETAGLQANDGSSELIQTMIDPDSWTQQGGAGDITILGGPSEETSGFAIRTTYRTHRKIEEFLASVRAGTGKPLSGSVGADRARGGRAADPFH